MITNREEVLENALRVFAKMNYEKASQTEIAKACGLSKAGLIYYYPLKLDLFIAVIDKYVFHMQSASVKFNFQSCTLYEFIEQYISVVKYLYKSAHSALHTGNILFNKFIQSAGLKIEFDGGRLHAKHKFIYHCDK